MMTQTLKEKLLEFIDKNFDGSSKEVEPVVEVTKSLDNEQRRALFVALEPQDGDETSDLHGDTYTAEEVEKACNNFNVHCKKANIFHKIQTEKAVIEQSFITPSAFTLDDGREIKKGTWLQWWHFPEGDTTSDMLWKAVKDGKITGISIGARAKTEKLDD
jgi:hypothetical protein